MDTWFYRFDSAVIVLTHFRTSASIENAPQAVRVWIDNAFGLAPSSGIAWRLEDEGCGLDKAYSATLVQMSGIDNDDGDSNGGGGNCDGNSSLHSKSARSQAPYADIAQQHELHDNIKNDLTLSPSTDLILCLCYAFTVAYAFHRRSRPSSCASLRPLAFPRLPAAIARSLLRSLSFVAVQWQDCTRY